VRLQFGARAVGDEQLGLARGAEKSRQIKDRSARGRIRRGEPPPSNFSHARLGMTKRTIGNNLKRKGFYALDYLCYSIDSVAARFYRLPRSRFLHSFAASHRPGRSHYPIDQRSTAAVASAS